ncbi:hypothetical protein Q31b_18450 [Novipirellula aureliae]|uniref:Uncharacterized protein n=1 Tax=Novipirellula aureliae TaxID=2527966 RepID=A0A5C6EAW4_9BACT|nr:hypothetical protein [Novipirellula aureliae]TWU44309.1 hypothetical protein Q31b_18450 [Novipirellula aureliae]
MKLFYAFVLLTLMVHVVGCGKPASRAVTDGADQAELDAYHELQRIKAEGADD